MKKVLVSTLSLAMLTGVVSPLANTTKASELTSPPIVESEVIPEEGTMPTVDESEVIPEEEMIEIVYEEPSIPIPLLSAQPTEGGNPLLDSGSTINSSWNYNKTVNYTQKAAWTSIASAASAIGLYTGIKQLSLTGIAANWIISMKGSWIYYSDKQYWRMAGSTLQTKHVITWYKDKAHKKKVGSSEYITNDRG